MIFAKVPDGMVPAVEQYLFIFISDVKGNLERKITSEHTCNISRRRHIAGENISTPSVEVRQNCCITSLMSVVMASLTTFGQLMKWAGRYDLK